MRFPANVLAMATLIAGCASTSDAERTGGPTRSGVGIIAEGCGLAATSGSGAVVGSEGTVVTVAHTLRGATMVTVIDADGTEHEATVTAFDKDIDLAVLDAPSLAVPPLPIGDVATGPGTALVWDRDTGVSEIDLDITKRLAVTIEDVYREGEVRRSAIEVDAEIAVGDSGGPVLDETAEVVGIIYANSRQRPGVGFAVDASEIRAAIDAIGTLPTSTNRCP